MPFFKPANTYLDCVSLQVLQSALKRKFNKERKRVYLFTSKGSITIEASIAISTFLIVVLFVESYLMLLNTEFTMQGKINNVVIETSRNVFYKSVLDELIDNNEKVKEIKRKVFESTELGSEDTLVKDGLKKSYLKTRLIQEINLKNTKYFLCQIAGINTTESTIEKGIVDLVATYKMEVPFVNKYITFTQRGKMRTWEGVDLKENQNMVYITKTGKVYHNTKDCTYLSIKISKTTYEECRNNYNRCNICVTYKPDLQEKVFITEDGKKYHYSLKCRGLVRNIITVSKEEVKEWPECNKCGKGK